MEKQLSHVECFVGVMGGMFLTVLCFCIFIYICLIHLLVKTQNKTFRRLRNLKHKFRIRTKSMLSVCFMGSELWGTPTAVAIYCKTICEIVQKVGKSLMMHRTS